MKNCDIIVPIYNSPEWVKLCVYALFRNTPDEYIGKVILMNDNSDEITLNCLKNLKEKYGDKVILKTNKKNLGFVKNVNAGLEMSNADTVLLLNTDCLIAKNTIPKLISHIEKDESIGLICPVSSNAANLTLEMYEGYSYMQMDELLEQNFSGINFDACTVVGNCLMITRKCLETVGNLDEIYGMGYGEETDYQFKSEEKGFMAKVAIDTYVFHKSEVSFGTSKEKQEKLEENRKIFFDRWGEAYNMKMRLYVQNDPIKYINDNLKNKLPKNINPEVLFFLPDIHQNAGGVHIVVDIVNYLNINGVHANILTERIHVYNEIMIFNPCFMNNIENIKPKCIVATIYPTIFFCKTIAQINNIPMVNFMQGYEPCFDNGEVYGWAELACKNSENILAISNFLKEECKENFDKEAEVISNGINIDLLYNSNKIKNDKKVITMSLRDTFLKGDFILLEILKKLTLKNYNIEVNVIYKRDINFPINNNSNVKINKYKGPLSRKEVINIMQKTDIFIDASFMEGFGLMSLEAMASGAIPILAQSFGILEYAKDNKNCFVINEVNNAHKYIEKIEYILNNEDKLVEMQKEAMKTSLDFDIDNRVMEYINYFKNVEKQEIILTEEEKEQGKRWEVTKNNLYRKNIVLKKSTYSKIAKLLPDGLKLKIKNIARKIAN